MHDPICLHSFRCLAGVKHQSFLDPNSPVAALWWDRLISTSCLPVSLTGSPVWPRPIRVLAVTRGEEVPLSVPKQRLICSQHKHYSHVKVSYCAVDSVTWTVSSIISCVQYLEVPKARTCRDRSRRWWAQAGTGRRSCGRDSAQRAPRLWGGTGTPAANWAPLRRLLSSPWSSSPLD